MSKRVLSLIEGEGLSPEELDELAELIRSEAEKKRKFSPLDRVRSMMHAVEKKYDSITPSSNWKECGPAIEQLNKINFASVLDSAIALEDVNDRWKAGMELTITFSAIMFDVEQWGYKLVNGSCGEFCPNLAILIEECWRQIVEKPERPTSQELIQQIKSEELGKCLGDYGELDFVIHELKATRVITQGENGESKEKIVYDLISDDEEDGKDAEK